MPDMSQIEMLENLADRLEDLETSYGKKPARHDVAKLIEARLDPLTNAIEGLAQQLSKAFVPMMETIERLDTSVRMLSKDMKDAIDAHSRPKAI